MTRERELLKQAVDAIEDLQVYAACYIHNNQNIKPEHAKEDFDKSEKLFTAIREYLTEPVSGGLTIMKCLNRPVAWVLRHRLDRPTDPPTVETSFLQAKRWLAQFKEGHAFIEPLYLNVPHHQDEDVVKDAEIATLKAERDEFKRRWATLNNQSNDKAWGAFSDADRIDWLERNPRLSEIIINGESKDCYFYGIAGAPGLKLREVIDSAIAQEKDRG